MAGVTIPGIGRSEKGADMRTSRRSWRAAAAVLLSLCFATTLPAQPAAPQPAPALSCADIEAFLKTAKVGRPRAIPVGVTTPSRTTLDNGTLQHDAAIQTADIRQATYTTPRGTELNFRDTWKFNVAGYELAKMLGLNMVPPYVERRISGGPASLSWWVNDAMMERDRVQKKITPPDIRHWNDEMQAARLFHELIGDYDFNQTNTLITKDWRVWMIDFTRAFRPAKTLQYPHEVARVDRTLFANLRSLSREGMRDKLGKWLTDGEINAVLARRDVLVGILEKQIAAKGEAIVLYDLPRAKEPCGAGLHP
jgi:hypothetical protein